GSSLELGFSGVAQDRFGVSQLAYLDARVVSSGHLPPLAMWPALPTADYHGDSVTVGLAPFGHPAFRVPLVLNVSSANHREGRPAAQDAVRHDPPGAGHRDAQRPVGAGRGDPVALRYYWVLTRSAPVRSSRRLRIRHQVPDRAGVRSLRMAERKC